MALAEKQQKWKWWHISLKTGKSCMCNLLPLGQDTEGPQACSPCWMKVVSIFPSSCSDHIRKSPRKPSERYAPYINHGAFNCRPTHRLPLPTCIKRLVLTNGVEPLQFALSGRMFLGICCVLFFFKDRHLGRRGLTGLWHLLCCTGQRVKPWGSNIHRLGLFLQPIGKEYQSYDYDSRDVLVSHLSAS